MAIPTAYTTSDKVASLLPLKLRGGDKFTSGTSPTKTMVDYYITLIQSQVDIQFRAAGYYIPFQVISGETWPDSQTNYLDFVTTMGAAAFAGGWALKPAPALDRSRSGGTGNVFQDLFDAELVRIYDYRANVSSIRFRALYYPDTAAEKAVEDPRSPTTEFLESKYDPYRYMNTHDLADKIMAIEQSMMDLEVNWDYTYSLFDIDKGFGTSIYEL